MTDPVASSPASDASAAVLAFGHRLLSNSGTDAPTLPTLLADLAAAYGSPCAGLVLPGAGGKRFHGGVEPTWVPDPATLERLYSSRLAICLPRAPEGSVLATVVQLPEQGGALLWLEDPRRSRWTTGETAALPLVGHVLERCLGCSDCSPRWKEQIERQCRQQALETLAQATRRLAHDLGNVFTGILGFTELGLGHPTPGTALVQSYLTEVFRSAQNGARLINQLRLFSRRQQVPTGSSRPGEVIREEINRINTLAEHAGKIRDSLGTDWPPTALEKEQLRLIIAAVLENAVEASPTLGGVSLAGRTVDLEADHCADYFGDLRPGPHFLVSIVDSGPGLTPEGWKRVLVEPFFTTKPRRRGLGLAVAYGILHGHRGGIRLRPRPEGGVLVEVVLPLASPPGSENRVQAGTSQSAGCSTKVLVVDDDLTVLSYVRATLEQAGYEVQTVTCAEEALRSYVSAWPSRFQLVLSDVLMPQTTGVDLARQLLQQDANLRLLFMSGQVGQEFTHNDLGQRFGLLPKPFARDGLLRAVRSALNPTGERRGASAPVSAGLAG